MMIPTAQARVGSPAVAVILLNWNNTVQTLSCLASLQQLDYENYWIVLVDNGSAPALTPDMLGPFPRVRLIRNSRNLGYTGGNNQAILSALTDGAEFFWLLNTDTQVSPSSLRLLVEYASPAEVGIVSPVVYYSHHPEKILFCGGWIDPLNFQKTFTRNLEQAHEWQEHDPDKFFVWGTAMLIKRAVVEKVGLLDERYFAYQEDTDYSLRTIRAGFRNLVVAEAAIWHDKSLFDPETIQYSPHYYFYRARNGIFFWKNHAPGMKKREYVRRTIAEQIRLAGELDKRGGNLEVNAVMDGIWAGIKGRGGSYADALTMPVWLRRILLRAPYFTSYLLEGNGSGVLTAINERRSGSIHG